MIDIELKKSFDDKYILAQNYFRIILGTISKTLSPKELELLAFIAVRDNILSTTARKDFIEKYNTTQATINNTLGRLKRMGLISKKQSKFFINPKIFSGLEGTINFKITLNVREGNKTAGS